MKRPKIIATGASLAAGAIATVALVSACGAGTPQSDDLQNLPPSYPNYAALYINVDGYPNIVELCINGAGFATTQRPDMGAVTRVEAWDAFCAKQAGKQATQDGQP